MTQELLRKEYRQFDPDYRYSRFCELYQLWRRKQSEVLPQEQKVGEKLEAPFPDDFTVALLTRFSYSEAVSQVECLGDVSYGGRRIHFDEEMAIVIDCLSEGPKPTVRFLMEKLNSRISKASLLELLSELLRQGIVALEPPAVEG